jgi:hypothetical protein
MYNAPMTELVYVLVLEAKFCEFESRLGHHLITFMNLIKPKIFLWGACDLFQSAKIDPILHEFEVESLNWGRTDSLDLQNCWTPNFSTSLRALYTPPNAVANRLYDTLFSLKEIPAHYYRSFREIAKFPYLKYFKENVGPKDVLLINFSTELYTKIQVGSEIFGMLSLVKKRVDLPNDPLHWLYKDYLSRKEFQIPFDTIENLEITYDFLKQFAIDIHDIFQDRVILVRTHFTQMALTNNAQISKVVVPVNKEIIYQQTRIMGDILDHSYAQRSTDIFIDKFHRWYKSEIPIVQYKGNVFVDPFHKLGDAPFHLHEFSTYSIGKEILKELRKINTRPLIQEASNVG